MSRIFPSLREVSDALPGLLLIVAPVIVASYILFWIEDVVYMQYHRMHGPVIALMIAAILALAVTNILKIPDRYQAGLGFTTKWLLKLGVILYGLGFSYSVWFRPGAIWLFTINIATVVIASATAYYLGKKLGLTNTLGALIGTGTSICGIAAVLATQPSIKQSKTEEAGVAIGTVLLWGTLGLFLYPVIAALFRIPPVIYGAWVGATIHDLPHIVATALQGGGETGWKVAMWIKMIRIGLIIPVVFWWVFTFARRQMSVESGKKTSYWKIAKDFPLFVTAFFVAIVLNTVFALPVDARSILATGAGIPLGASVASICLTSAVVGICFRVRKDIVKRAGWKAVATGGVAWAIQSILIFALINMIPLPAP